MVRAGLVIFALVLLSACSSSKVDYKPPYCYTDQTIKTTDGKTVSSETTLECSDRPGQQTKIQRAGIDKGCEEFWYSEIRNGQAVPVRGVRCERLDGSWEILNVNGFVR